MTKKKIKKIKMNLNQKMKMMKEKKMTKKKTK